MYMVTLSIIFPPGFIINVILFWRIFKSDVLRSLKADKTVIPNKSNSKKEDWFMGERLGNHSKQK